MAALAIVSRAEWGARKPTRRATMALPSRELWGHHTASEQHGTPGLREIQDYHMDSRGYTDIAYNFLVDDDGTAYEGRGAGVVGGHTIGHNSISHAICWMANLENRPPTPEAMATTRALRDHGFARGWWPDHFTGGHRQASGASTVCPGRFGMEMLQKLAKVGPQNPEDDMSAAAEQMIAEIHHELVVKDQGNAWRLLRDMNHQIVVPGVGLQAVVAKVDALATVGSTPAAIAEAIVSQMTRLDAKAIADEIAERLQA